MTPDGYVILKFKDGDQETFAFCDIQYHGIVQSHVRIESEILPEGPLVYSIRYDWGRRVFPWDTIREIHIHGNSDEYVEWARTQKKDDADATD